MDARCIQISPKSRVVTSIRDNQVFTATCMVNVVSMLTTIKMAVPANLTTVQQDILRPLALAKGPLFIQS